MNGVRAAVAASSSARVSTSFTGRFVFRDSTTQNGSALISSFPPNAPPT